MSAGNKYRHNVSRRNGRRHAPLDIDILGKAKVVDRLLEDAIRRPRNPPKLAVGSSENQPPVRPHVVSDDAAAQERRVVIDSAVVDGTEAEEGRIGIWVRRMTEVDTSHIGDGCDWRGDWRGRRLAEVCYCAR